MDRLEYLHQVEWILNAQIPPGHSVEEVIWENADADTDPAYTAELIADSLIEFDMNEQAAAWRLEQAKRRVELLGRRTVVSAKAMARAWAAVAAWEVKVKTARVAEGSKAGAQ